jgi:hypothetical protein
MNAPVVLKTIQSPYKSQIPGTKLLLMGPSGSGKTYFIGQILEAGYKVRALFTEPGMESVGKYFQDRNKPIPDNYKAVYVAPVAADWATMIDAAKKINQLDQKALANIGDMNKSKYKDFIGILTALSNFTTADGESFGAADDWGTDTFLIVDSLSGLSMAAMNLVTGSKPMKSQPDWGMAMDTVERLITKLTCDLRCHMVLMAHVEREADEITGGSNVTVSTLGRKLAPKLPRYFSDVILTQRQGTEFSWSTAAVNTDTKARNIPINSKITPSIKVIMDSWLKNGGVVEP